MEEPTLLTDEELAFIQQLYNQPEKEQPESLSIKLDLDEPLNDLLSGYAKLENISLDLRIINQDGNVHSVIPVYTQDKKPTCDAGILETTVLQLLTQERVRRLEAEVARLKIRLTDTTP